MFLKAEKKLSKSNPSVMLQVEGGCLLGRKPVTLSVLFQVFLLAENGREKQISIKMNFPVWEMHLHNTDTPSPPKSGSINYLEVLECWFIWIR